MISQSGREQCLARSYGKERPHLQRGTGMNPDSFGNALKRMNHSPQTGPRAGLFSSLLVAREALLRLKAHF